MKILKTFNSFVKLNEMGGWATTKTQGTQITPALLQEAVLVLTEIFDRFNAQSGEAPLKVLGPGGSGVYYKQDLAENPEKSYGDVDILVEYPLAEPQSRRVEIDTLKRFNSMMLDWIQANPQPNIDAEESEAISEGNLKLVINLSKGPVQVDVIPTFTYSADWAKARYTPIRGVKGFVVGFLYQALGNALGVSITDRGVVAKIKGGELVSPSFRKDVEERIVTRDFSRFIAHLAEFIDEFTRGEKRLLQLDSYLEAHPGIDVSDLTLEQICDGILGLARTLESNGTFDQPRSKYSNARELLNAVIEIYRAKIEKHKGSSKYDKAQTEIAFKQREKVMSDADEAFGYVKQKLS